MSLTESESKHYALPEEGQTQEDFIKEELMKEPKTTILEWVKIAVKLKAKRSMLMERIKDWPIYEEFIRLAEEFDSNDDNEKTVSKDSKVSKDEKKDDVDPSKTSEEVKKVEEDPPVDVEQVELDKKMEKQETVGSSKRAAIGGFIKKRVSISAVDHFVSGLVIEMTNEKYRQFYSRYDRGVTLGTYTDLKTFKLAWEQMITQLMGTYQLVVGIPTVISTASNFGPKGVRRSDPKKWGFDLISVIQKQFHPRTSAVKVSWGKNEPTAGKTESKVRVALLDNEIHLYKVTKKRVLRDFYDVERLLDFLRAYASDVTSTFFRMSPEMKRFKKFKKTILRIHSSKYLTKMIDRIPVLRERFVTMVGSMVESTIFTENFSVTQTFTNYLRGAEIRINEYNMANSVAPQILRHSPAAFFKGLMSVLLNGRHLQITYEVGSYTDFSYTVLLDCIIMKLFLPMNVVHPETIRDIDNYIYTNLIMNKAKWNSKRDMHSTDIKGNDVNVLTEVLSQSDFGGITKFLLTTDDGGGWANGGVILERRVTSHVEFFHSMVRYEYPYGVVFNDDNTSFPQLENFKAFIKVVLSGTFFDRNFRERIRLQNYLKLVAGRTEDFRKLGRMITRAMEKLTVCSLCYPAITKVIRAPKPLAVLEREERRIAIGQPHAFSALAQVKGFVVKAVPFRYIEDGLAAREWAYELVQRYDYIKRKLSEKFFSDQDRLDFVFNDDRKVTTSLDSAVKTFYLSFLRQDFSFPLYEEKSNRLDEDRKPFEEELKKNSRFYGYVNRYYLMRTPNVVERGVFSELHVYEPKDGQRVESLTYDEMVKLAQDYKLNLWIRERFYNDIVIEFKMPSRFQPIEIKLDHDFPRQKVTFGVGVTNGELMLPYSGTFDFYYQIKDRIRDSLRDERIHIPSNPTIVPHIEDVPFFLDKELDDYFNMVKDMSIPTKNVEYLHYGEFVKQMLTPFYRE